MSSTQQFLPIKITGPRRFHISLAVISYLGCFIGFMKFGASGIEETDDMVTICVLILTAIWFTYKTIVPTTKIIFSKDGIWTDVHGQKTWDDFGGVAIEKQNSGRRRRTDMLLFLFYIENDLQEISYDFLDLSINVKKFKELLDGPLKPYMEL